MLNCSVWIDPCNDNFEELHFPQCLCPYRRTTRPLKPVLDVTDSTPSDNVARAAVILTPSEHGALLPLLRNGDHRPLRAVQKRSNDYQTVFNFIFEWDSWNRRATISLMVESRPFSAVPPRNPVVLQGSRRTLHVPRDRREIRKRTNQKSSRPGWSRVDGRSRSGGFLSRWYPLPAG